MRLLSLKFALGNGLRSGLAAVGLDTVERQIHGTRYRVPLLLGTSPWRMLLDRSFLRDYEGTFFTEFTGRLDADDLVFDVGAYVGLYTICIARTGARVHAFEPNPRTRELLQLAVDANKLHGRVVVVAKAATVRSGPVQLFKDDARSSVVQPREERPEQGSWTVDGTSLDEYALSIGEYPSVLKVDVEGAEVDVLQGAAECLSRSHLVAIEVHPVALERHNRSEDDVNRLLERHGFRLATRWHRTHGPRTPAFALWEKD